MIFLNNFYLRKGRASARKSGGGNLTFSGCQCRSGRYEIAIKKRGCVSKRNVWVHPLFRGLGMRRLCPRADCTRRACFCTCSTVGTYFRINAVDISLGDCFHRTFIDTCTTCNTIFTNYVSHFLLFLKLEQCKSKQFFRLKKMFVFFFILSFAAITFFFFRYSYKIKAN